jgi:hypothetical protein
MNTTSRGDACRQAARVRKGLLQKVEHAGRRQLRCEPAALLFGAACCYSLLLAATDSLLCLLLLAAYCLLLTAATGCWLLAAGCWLLAAGCWLLAAGCWLLAAGCWLLVLAAVAAADALVGPPGPRTQGTAYVYGDHSAQL